MCSKPNWLELFALDSQTMKIASFTQICETVTGGFRWHVRLMKCTKEEEATIAIFGEKVGLSFRKFTMQVRDNRYLKKVGTRDDTKDQSPQTGTTAENANLVEKVLVVTTSLTSLVEMHTKPDNGRGLSLRSRICKACSLLYDAAAGLGVSPHLVARSKAHVLYDLASNRPGPQCPALCG